MFKKKCWADMFQKGLLYCNRVKYFKKNGSDEYEGDVLWWPRLYRDNNGMPITSPNLVGFASIRVPIETVENIHVFCMYAAYSLEGPTNSVAISDQCRKEFGEHAVLITNPVKFFQRMELAILEQRVPVQHGLVTYYSGLHPLMNSVINTEPDRDSAHFRQAVFYKRTEFQHQKEYRIAFDMQTEGDDPCKISVFDLSDITHYVMTVQLQHANIRIRSETTP